MGSLLNYSTLLLKSIGWFQFILDITIKGSLLLGVAFLILFFWKKASASARHLVLYLAIISLLSLPIISYFLPTWELSFFNSVKAPQKVLSTENSDDFGKVSPLNDQNDNIKLPLKIHWSVALMALWTLGTVCILFRLFAGLIGRWWIVLKSSPIEDKELKELFTEYSEKLGISKDIRIIQSSKARIPITWGHIHPTILVPNDMHSWSEKRKVIVILHELAHIKRGDALTTSMVQFASVLYWFNPLIWAAIRQFYIEREHASDNVVITSGTKAADYAHHLLEIARSLSLVRWPIPSPVEVAMAQKSHLEGRLLAILNKKEYRNPLKRSTIILVCCLTLAVILPVASIQTWAKSDKEEKVKIPPKKAITKLLLSYNKAFEAQDLESLLNFYSKDFFTKIDKDKKYAIEKWKKEIYKTYFYKRKKTLVDSKILKIKKKEKDIYLLYEIVSILGVDKKGVKDYICKKNEKLFVFVKEDGKWKISFIEYKKKPKIKKVVKG